MTMERTAIGVDLGCTNIKAVLVDHSGAVIHQTRVETREQDEQHWKQAIRDIIKDFRRHPASHADTIGLCAPGLANAENTAIDCMPGRLPGLEKFDWSQFAGKKVWVINDAHAALTAEAQFGAAKGLQNAVLMTLGSGVGGGILINGALYQGTSQMAGHVGHMTVNAHTEVRDVTNMPGSIEDAIGNITIRQRSYGRYQTTFELIEAFRQKETFATWLWLDSLRKLAINIASTINILAPEAVIIGGGIAQAEDALMAPLKEFLDLYEWRPTGKRTEIRMAHFSDMAGALGAAAFALMKSSHA